LSGWLIKASFRSVQLITGYLKKAAGKQKVHQPWQQLQWSCLLSLEMQMLMRVKKRKKEVPSIPTLNGTVSKRFAIRKKRKWVKDVRDE